MFNSFAEMNNLRWCYQKVKVCGKGLDIKQGKVDSWKFKENFDTEIEVCDTWTVENQNTSLFNNFYLNDFLSSVSNSLTYNMILFL